MKRKIQQLTEKCQNNLALADKIRFAQRMLFDAQESQFFYSEKEIRNLLKVLSPFSKTELSKICKEFNTNFEYFSSDIVHDFLVSVKKKILLVGQKDQSYFDSVECLYAIGGSSFTGSTDNECTSKDFCVEFIDRKTKKQFSVVFPVAENWYFKTNSDFETVLKGTFKIFNLGLSFADLDKVNYAYNPSCYHPCICATNDVEELSSALKRFLTTDELDTTDLFGSTFFRYIQENVSYGNQESIYHQTHRFDDDLFNFDGFNSWNDSSNKEKLSNILETSSISSILEKLSTAYDDVKYRRVKVK